MKKIIVALTIMVAGHLNGMSQQLSGIQFTDGKSESRMSFDLYNNLIFLHCTVNNSKPGWFIFDTGSAVTMLDSTFAVDNQINIRDTVISRFSGKKVPGSKHLTFHIGHAQLSEVSARVMNTFQLSSVIGRKIDGIIGYDFLEQFVVEVDYFNRNLRFMDPGKFTYKGKGKPLALELNKANWPMTPVVLHGNDKQAEGMIILDSGSLMGLSLTSSELAEETIPYPISFGITGAGEGSRMGRLDTFEIDGNTINNCIAGFPAKETDESTDDISRTVSESGLGLIGSEIMVRFTWTFDYTRKTVFVEPNARIHEPFEFDMSGLTIITIDDAYKTFMIIATTSGSPAEQSGLQPGDILLEFNDIPAGNYTLSELRDLFKTESKTFNTRIRRNEDVLEKSFITRKMI